MLLSFTRNDSNPKQGKAPEVQYQLHRRVAKKS